MLNVKIRAQPSTKVFSRRFSRRCDHDFFFLFCLTFFFFSFVSFLFFCFVFLLLFKKQNKTNKKNRFTTVLSQWIFSNGKFGLLSPEKASCDRVALPNLRCMLGVLVFPQQLINVNLCGRLGSKHQLTIIYRTLTWTAESLTCTTQM